MQQRSFVLGRLPAAMAVAGLLLTPASAAAQAGEYEPPRTSWGAPDLQGVWDFRTLTPFERPVELGERAVLSAEEVAEFEARRLASSRCATNQEPADVVGNYNQFWFDPGSTAVETRRTSLVIEPSNGRIPPLTSAATQKRAELERVRRGLLMHDVTRAAGSRTWARTRCSALHRRLQLGPADDARRLHQNVQLFQTEDHVSAAHEMVHNARIVPLDGRPHLDPDIRQWTGDSRGYWDGDTLVVETANFLRETGFRRGSSDEHLHLTERFTRVSPSTLMYEATIDNPTVWTEAWTYQIPMQANDQPMYEYACHEGNYGLYNMLAGAREAERAAEAAAAR